MLNSLRAAESGTPKGADLKKAFKVGEAMKCLVTDVEGDRVRLSKSQAEVAQERAEAREYLARSPKASGKGFGTLGDLLKEKLKER